MFLRLDRVRSTKRRPRARLLPSRRAALPQERCAPRPVARFRDNQFFNVRVRKLREWVDHARRCVLVSGARCIPRARLQPVRVLSVSALVFRLRAQLVPVPVPVLQHVGRASVMSRAA